METPKFYTYPSGDFVRATFPGCGFFVQWKKDASQIEIAKRLRDLCQSMIEEKR